MTSWWDEAWSQPPLHLDLIGVSALVCLLIGQKYYPKGHSLKTIRVVVSIPIAHLPRSVRIEASSPDVIGLLPVSSPLVGWSPPLCLPSLPLVVTDLSLSPRDPDGSCQHWPPAVARASIASWYHKPAQEEKGNDVTIRGGGFLFLYLL